MESRKLGLKNLLTEQQWRNRQNRLMGRGEERVRCMKRVTWKLGLPNVKQIATGIFCMAQETQTGALYQPRGMGWAGRWERGSKGRGGMYTYG